MNLLMKYTCHALEHFPRRKVFYILCEYNRILNPSGLLIIDVSDLEKVF